MTYPNSFVMICPAASRSTIEQFGLTLGYSGHEFTVPLSASGAEPATHYGLHTWAQDETVALFMSDEAIPGLTGPQIAWLRATLILSAQTDVQPLAHFAAVCAAHGLTRIEPVEAEP